MCICSDLALALGVGIEDSVKAATQREYLRMQNRVSENGQTSSEASRLKFLAEQASEFCTGLAYDLMDEATCKAGPNVAVCSAEKLCESFREDFESFIAHTDRLDPEVRFALQASETAHSC